PGNEPDQSLEGQRQQRRTQEGGPRELRRQAKRLSVGNKGLPELPLTVMVHRFGELSACRENTFPVLACHAGKGVHEPEPRLPFSRSRIRRTPLSSVGSLLENNPRDESHRA